MRTWLTRLGMLLAGSTLGLGCGPKAIQSGSEAILYSPNFNAIGIGNGTQDAVEIPVGTRVLVLDTSVSQIPGIGKLPAETPPVVRISIKEGKYIGMVVYVEQEFLKPIP